MSMRENTERGKTKKRDSLLSLFLVLLLKNNYVVRFVFPILSTCCANSFKDIFIGELSSYQQFPLPSKIVTSSHNIFHTFRKVHS